ncbi:MAG: hypothetical protein LBD03_05865 [Methanobrevibacter sp.]|nr:hypothetical protein [Candidatus Methanovirga procula]
MCGNITEKYSISRIGTTLSKSGIKEEYLTGFHSPPAKIKPSSSKE